MPEDNSAQSGKDACLRKPVAQAIVDSRCKLLGVHWLAEQADFAAADQALRQLEDDGLEVVKNMSHFARKRRNSEITNKHCKQKE